MLVFLAFENSEHLRCRVAAPFEMAMGLSFESVRCLDTFRESHECSFYLALLFNFTCVHRNLG